MPEPQLRRGLFAEADIHVDPAARTLAVPRAAVREFAGVEKVWRVADGEAAEQQVETGRQNDAFAEILGGLSAGDVVVVEDFPKQAGPVEVVERNSRSDVPDDPVAHGRRTACNGWLKSVSSGPCSR